MKSWLCRVGVLFVALTLVFSMMALNVHGTEEPVPGTANKFNVVFVIDGSGSILSTDSPKWRYEAIDLFLALLTETGNRVGGIVFDDTILSKVNMVDVNAKSDKDTISASLEQVAPKGDTDIGLALNEATKMLDSQRNQELPSVILLLTDGETDLKNVGESTYARSSELKSAAITSARNNGYPVYGVALNANGKANVSEVKSIADATGGKYIEISNSSDLMNVFSEFYSLIYSAVIEECDGEFTVPKIGVEEVNIVIYSSEEIRSIQLWQPSGVELSQQEISGYTTRSDYFTLVKISHPMPGKWQLKVEGATDDMIRINLIRNIDFFVESTASEDRDTYGVGSQIQVKTIIRSGGEVVTDPDAYVDYAGTMLFSNSQSGVVEELALVSRDGAFYIDINLEEYGTFYATAVLKGEGVEREGNTLIFNVGNTAPQSKDFKDRKIVFPFSKPELSVVLSDYVHDAEDTELAYSVEKSTLNVDQYQIQGDQLLMFTKDAGDYAFTLLATDSQGATCSVECQVSVVNILTFLLKCLLGLVALAALAFLVLKLMRGRKKFFGMIKVETFNDEQGRYDPPITVEPVRGSIKLQKIVSDGEGVGLGSQFLATGKNYVWFHSDKPVYTSGGFSKTVKNVEIRNYNTITISPDQELRRGIKVTFISHLS